MHIDCIDRISFEKNSDWISVERGDDFDLEKIRDSGQCFRLFNLGKCNTNKELFLLIAKERVLYLKQDYEKVYFKCGENDFTNIWWDYFDLGLDYTSIRARINEEADKFLYKASHFGRGIRILNQDPWETLITFIISQRKNIPAIQKAVSIISERAGIEIGRLEDGRSLFSFPSPEQMLNMQDKDYEACKLGYREKYIRRAVEDMTSGEKSLDLHKLNNDELDIALREFYGVGKKISDCVSLFAYHRLSNCPMDVWMKRVEEEFYQGNLDLSKQHPYEGLMQQYLFYYIRRM